MRYTPVVGQKFYADGTVRPFPGNTLLCMLDPAAPVFARVAWVAEQFAAHPFARHFALLPPSSFHMTVMDLLCDEVRDPAHWSRLLGTEVSLAESDAFLMQAVITVPAPPTFQMEYTSLSTEGGVRLNVAPANDATHRAIRGYRDAVAEVTGIHLPTHEAYGFHISVAYRLMEPEAGEDAAIAAWVSAVDPVLRETFGRFDTGQPHLAFFDDMARFVPAADYATLYTRA